MMHLLLLRISIFEGHYESLNFLKARLILNIYTQGELIKLDVNKFTVKWRFNFL
ncbi:hypothetical protein VCR17J2_200004 [Vibrio coralliirubri]|nr:hypothetical protein VCR17J2_200004 [Vibrio coralliirubri]